MAHMLLRNEEEAWIQDTLAHRQLAFKMNNSLPFSAFHSRAVPSSLPVSTD
jgi:hypothetical protein